MNDKPTSMDDINGMIGEAVSNGENEAFYIMMKLQQSAWYGLMQAIDNYENQLTDAETARAITFAVIEVMTELDMPEDKVLAVVMECCKCRAADWEV